MSFPISSRSGITMKSTGTLILVTVVMVCAPLNTTVRGAEKSSSASQVSGGTGRPSAVEIKQHFLEQQTDRIKGEIRQAERCIANATNPQTLRDPEGNVNRTPKIDATDCARRLQQLVRQLTSLGRKAEMLAQDAEATAMRLERLLMDAERAKRTQPAQAGESSGM